METTWEEMADAQISRIAVMSPADQVDILRNSLRAFGQAVDRANTAHMKYLSDRLADVDARIIANECESRVDASNAPDMTMTHHCYLGNHLDCAGQHLCDCLCHVAEVKP